MEEIQKIHQALQLVEALHFRLQHVLLKQQMDVMQRVVVRAVLETVYLQL
jgi:hypothetical protein